MCFPSPKIVATDQSITLLHLSVSGILQWYADGECGLAEVWNDSVSLEPQALGVTT